MSESLPVPFGKYKGQSAEVLAADPQYMEWLISQGWVRDKFPQFYTLIINNLGEVGDTPDHNAMQALFLGKSLCVQVTHMIWKRFNLDGIPAGCGDPVFEPEGGGDVRVNVSAWVEREQTRLVEDLSAPLTHPMWNGRMYEQREETYYTWDKFSGISHVILELKPSLGDDFPGILRAAKRLETFGGSQLRCVLYNVYTGVGAPVEDVERMFASSFVLLASMEELRRYPDTFVQEPPTREE